MPLLRVTALHKYYGDHHVLKGIDLTVEQGQVVAIIGRSGPCGVHSHSHEKARLSSVPVSDFQGFWGAFGCSCFAF